MEQENNTHKARGQFPDVVKLMATISWLHGEVSKIPETNDRRSYDAIEKFLEVLSRFIQKLEIFSHHTTWECISETVPEHLETAENFLLRNVTPKEYRNAPFKKTDAFPYPHSEYFQAPLSKQEFSRAFSNYFNSGSLTRVFELPLKQGNSHINIPIFSEHEPMPRFVITLVYKDESAESIHHPGFQPFMEHLAQQISTHFIN